MWLKHKKSPYFLTMALLAAIILLLASCRLLEQPTQETEQPGQEEAEAVQETETAIGPAEVEIEIWNFITPKERLTLMDSVEEFQNQNQQIEVQTRHIRSEEELLDQFEAASLAGSGPDLILTDLVNVQRLAESKVVREITDIDFEIFLEGLAEISSYNGRNYAIPFRAEDFMVFYYNQSLMDSAPRDFETVLEYSQEVNNQEEQMYGFILNESEPDWIIPFIGGYSDWIVDYSNYSLSPGYCCFRTDLRLFAYHL
ncbi:MAG: extracellular solute-binding protein [Actinomycetota bacterium]|nr:extracellular solute-binding protein [Actinomycetota bacterium]